MSWREWMAANFLTVEESSTGGVVYKVLTACARACTLQLAAHPAASGRDSSLSSAHHAPRLTRCAHCAQSELMPDLAFFSKEQAMEYVKGKKYKKLKLDMKKGMRT